MAHPDLMTGAELAAQELADERDRRSEFGSDRCQGCGAAWNGLGGAFDCGYPSADCPAMVDDDDWMPDEEDVADEEEDAAFEAFLAERAAHEAELAAFEALLFEAGDQADADVMDAWETDLFPREEMEFELMMASVRADEALEGYVFRA
jgi:hypothetical protein